MALFIVLLATLLLRFPSWFEPYWYGDEGIYLAIGQAMQRGAVLYRDIWDNKPPLLYVLYGLAPTLLWAKIIATAFVLGTTAVTYFLLKRLIHKKWLVSLGALSCGTILSIPLLEGTIANAELYFTLPIGLGVLLALQILHEDCECLQVWGRVFLMGVLAFIAFLFKVPAIFDFGGIFLALSMTKFSIKRYAPAAIGFGVPLVLVVLYFWSQGALKDFLIAAFSQNASYVAIDTGPWAKLSNPLIVRGIMLVAAMAGLFWAGRKKIISQELLVLGSWWGFSLYGALLSNRPYMHYLLQIVPSTVVLVFYTLANLKRNWWVMLGLGLVFVPLGKMFGQAFALPSKEYYGNWFEYVSERKTWDEYVNFFDRRTLNSYAVAAYLDKNTHPDDPIFVWGDAAFVYVLSDRPAATRFIQAHHLTTIDKSNYQKIISKLEAVKPKYILVSRPVIFPFPELENLLQRNYQQADRFNDLEVYKKRI